MGLQPIDLQTMYSQMSNMAMQASVSEHSLQAVQNAQNKDIVRQMEEQKNKVLEAETERRRIGKPKRTQRPGRRGFFR
ncbi:MAG: hypothetical protein L6V86_04755 [Treponema sp.]|nr:MAG: hypothetical protein L6V86_04755 [Treponema sp.]